MTNVRLDKFMGMAPKLSDRLLPDAGAAIARNARLVSGELRGIRNPALVHKFSGTTRNARRIYDSNGQAVWLGLQNADTDIVKGPLVNDGFDRYYWTGEQLYVAYNSLARIASGDPPYRLGTPTPTATPTLTVVGGTGASETRAYVYTYINSWGEESAPGPVVVASGPFDGSWNLAALPSTVPDSTDRLPVVNKRIYRTVTGLGTASYFYVGQVALATTTYNDTIANAVVAAAPILQSFGWAPPPDNLKGLIAHPNGFLVGFVGKDIYFSERYRPHTWPTQYITSLEFNVVGLSVYNNMVAALTTGNPYFIAGNRAANVTINKSDSVEPCLSKQSIISTLSGVLYASPNGLVALNEGGPSIVTSQLLSIEEWNRYSPTTLKAAQYGQQYLAYYSPTNGIRFAPSEQFALLVELDAIADVDNVISDPSTGECWLLRNNSVFRWEPPTGVPMSFTWRSKVFDFTRPVNFGAYMLKSKGISAEEGDAEIALLLAYNTERFNAGPLNPMNFTPLGGKRTVPMDVGLTPPGIEDVPQNKYPFGGNPLYDVQALEDATTQITLNVYADGELIYSGVPEPLRTYRLPSGFKAHTWQFELIGNSDVYSLAVAETAKSLDRV
jgi:hypothetical protein